jgi:hypothetical protein
MHSIPPSLSLIYYTKCSSHFTNFIFENSSFLSLNFFFFFSRVIHDLGIQFSFRQNIILFICFIPENVSVSDGCV